MPARSSRILGSARKSEKSSWPSRWIDIPTQWKRAASTTTTSASSWVRPKSRTRAGSTPCFVSWRRSLRAMFVTIWMCTQEWSLICIRATALTFETCHQPLTWLSALTRSISVRSLRLPRTGTLIRMRETASAGERRASRSASASTGCSIRSAVYLSIATGASIVRAMSAQASSPQLRPLGVGEILDVGIKIYMRNALTLFKIVVFVVLPAQILVNIAEISALPSNVTLTGHQLTVLLVGLIAAFLIQFVAGRFAQAGCFRAVADAYLGEEVGWRSSLGFALRRLPAIVGLSIVSGIVVGLGWLFCIIPGIYLYVAFAVAVPVLLVEGAGPIRALGRSRELVQGRWWGTLGVAVVGYLLVTIVSLAISGLVVGVAFAHPARNTVTGFVLNTLAATLGSMITTPAAAAFITVLYIDLRVRKEGFDLLLLARRLGLELEPGQEPPSFLPEPPPPGSQPPFWPPPPGWVPGPESPFIEP